MSIVDERVLREFMLKHYPKYVDNLALARILYARHVGSVVGGLPKVQASNLNDYVGITVWMSGVLAGLSSQNYYACPRCFLSLKKCKCEVKVSEPLERTVYELLVGDNTGVVRVVFWSAESMFLRDEDVGKEVEVTGVVVEDSGECYLKGRSVRVMETGRREKVDEVLSILREMERVKTTVMEGLLKKYGVALDEVKNYLIQEGDYWVWKK